ncbi:Flagellar P-ring protein precursor [Rubripirellula obstinata]|uniref:Flagellar P-ring protein n=1 Tax=Rubripirellula obstinata TaxID=406547 RepID=A0A5B1CIT4_9BACT|nr:flagellar basal body P-ring protein FlgI [Rubripirellula obstinata]KAA1259520.1 Flagellar P-ring protein precursor [Rubripirellula obstinata]
MIRLILALTVFITSLTSVDAAGMRLANICRVKGQETNTLQGLGLVVGLRGTGDSGAAPTARALARMMQLMGGPISIDRTGQLNLDDVADAKNVAMVFVTATVPAVGAQAGDSLNVTINAINAKSLEGGTLMLTPLLGPRSDNPTVYAMAQGALNVSLDGPATTAKIQGGAKMEASVSAQYQKDGKITLILEKDFASFDTAQRIEDEINGLSSLTLGDATGTGKSGRTSARAIDQLHIEVLIPELYRDNPIKFISFLLGTTIQINNHSSRVVINERDGVVVIGKDVEVAPVLVTHRNLRIEAGGGGGFVAVGDKNDVPANAKLKSLADALNALDVPAEDLIAIIKTLKRKGDLYGEVVFQ